MFRQVDVKHRETGNLAGRYTDQRARILSPQRTQCGSIRGRMFVAAGPGYRRSFIAAARKARQTGRDRRLSAVINFGRTHQDDAPEVIRGRRAKSGRAARPKSAARNS